MLQYHDILSDFRTDLQAKSYKQYGSCFMSVFKELHNFSMSSGASP